MNQEVTLGNDEDVKSVESMLKFIYGLDLPEASEDLVAAAVEAINLLAVAQRYSVVDLLHVSTDRFDTALTKYLVYTLGCPTV